MKFLIIGHPKCGSKFMSKMMADFGYEIGHEKMGRHGISCWQNVNCLTHLKQYWGPQRTEKEFYEHKIHYVRNPYDAISSIMVENRVPESYNFRRSLILHHFGIDLNNHDEVNGAVLSYIYYNRLAEAQGPNVRIQVEHAYEQMADYLKVEKPNGSLPTNINSNADRKKHIEWNQITQRNYYLLNEACKRYGYMSISESKLNLV